MSDISVKMKWDSGIAFEGKGVFGHTIRTDGAVEAGGQGSGYKPTELVLFGIASCTGVDVVRILEKQRQKLASLEIEVTATQGDDYPKPFRTFEVKYTLTGDQLDEKKVAQAIDLSASKYCVVSQTMESEAKVITSFEIRG